LETTILTIGCSAEVEFVFLPKMSVVAVVGDEANAWVVDFLYPLSGMMSHLSLLRKRRDGASQRKQQDGGAGQFKRFHGIVLHPSTR